MYWEPTSKIRKSWELRKCKTIQSQFENVCCTFPDREALAPQKEGPKCPAAALCCMEVPRHRSFWKDLKNSGFLQRIPNQRLHTFRTIEEILEAELEAEDTKPSSASLPCTELLKHVRFRCSCSQKACTASFWYQDDCFLVLDLDGFSKSTSWPTSGFFCHVNKKKSDILKASHPQTNMF